MLSAEETLRDEFSRYDWLQFECSISDSNMVDIIRAMKEYRNQGIQQASEVCSEMLTDGFRISNIPAVLALKEEI